MTARSSRPTLCEHCGELVIQGKLGWRERLCNPKPLNLLYVCKDNRYHKAK